MRYSDARRDAAHTQLPLMKRESAHKLRAAESTQANGERPTGRRESLTVSLIII